MQDFGRNAQRTFGLGGVTMIFCLETANEYNSEFELITSLMQHCDALKANGDWFRGKCFTCYSDYGTKYKVQFKYDGGKFTSVEVRREKMLIPNFVFPYWLKNAEKNLFFRAKDDMLQFLRTTDQETFTLQTTSETLLSKSGTITTFEVKFDAKTNVLVVGGKNYPI